MLKSKLFFGLMALMMVIGAAQSSYAQITVTAIANPSPTETATNRTADTNNPVDGGELIITASALSDAFVTVDEIRIDYPGVITNTVGTPVGDAIRIVTATGFFTGATIDSVDYDDGRIDIDVAPGAGFTPVAGDTGTITLAGVRIDANGLTAPVNATVTTTGDASVNVILSNSSVPVITALAPGIASINLGVPAHLAAAAPSTGVATIFTNRTVADATATFYLQEGHNSAWFDSAFPNLTGAPATFSADSSVRLLFEGIPSGVTLTLTGELYSGTTSTTPLAFGVTFSDSTMTAPSDTGPNNNRTDITWNATGTGNSATLDTGAIQRLVIRVNATVAGGTAALPAGALTVKSTMIPIGAALDDSDPQVPLATFPRYAEAYTSTVTIGSIVAANSTLLVPYAAAEGAYNTGLAIANTTADPFGVLNGGSTTQSGTVKLSFYPRTATGVGTPFSLTTSATVRPGLGLDAAGSLPAGGTWSVLLSDLLTAAAQPAAFSGYIFIETSFQNAHGAAFISDFNNFTSATPMLVMPQPSIGAGRTGTTEALDF